MHIKGFYFLEIAVSYIHHVLVAATVVRFVKF